MGGLIESGFVIEHSEAFGGSLCLMLHWAWGRLGGHGFGRSCENFLFYRRSIAWPGEYCKLMMLFDHDFSELRVLKSTTR